MKITNLVLSLLERERFGNNNSNRKFAEILEHKTATLSTIHFNYDLQEAARSTFVIAFSPDRTKIATSHGNHTVKISDCFTFKVILTLKGHPRTPWCVTFHSRINSILASGCLGGQVRVWDLNKVSDDNIVFQSQAVISSLSFHPTDDILAISTHNKIIFYDWNTRQMLKTIQMQHHSETIRLVRFLPDGSKLITGIANASSQYCKPERLNVSTRGDPDGHSVVQTVSCMRMQQRSQEEKKAQCTMQTQNQDSSEKKNQFNGSKETEKVASTGSTKREYMSEKRSDRFKRKVAGKLHHSNDIDCNKTDEYVYNKCSRSRKKVSKQNNGPSSKLDTSICSKINRKMQTYSDQNRNEENESSSSKTVNEFCTVKRDPISLSHKSCINFFRQRSSGYANTREYPSLLCPSVRNEPGTSSVNCGDNVNSVTNDCTTTTTSPIRCEENSISTEAETAAASLNRKSCINFFRHRSSAYDNTTENPSLRCPHFTTTEFATSSASCGDNGNSTTSEPISGTSSLSSENNSNSNEIETGASPIRCTDNGNVNLSNHDIHVANESTAQMERNPSVLTGRLHRKNNGQHGRSEIWNFKLGPTVSSDHVSTSESLNDLDVSVEGASSTIPVHGYLTFPFSNMDQSTDVTNLLGVRTAVATATARSSHHVHTAVVIASQENENSETTLQTAVNRAIAGAFAGSGEGAVANNIIDTTHRLQLWDSFIEEYPDIQNEHKNVIAPLCKIHNDSSFDVSQDSSCMAVFVPSEYGFPMDAQIKVISLKAETFLHCIYSRKFGPNAVSVSLSSLNNYLMIGLASRKLHWQLSSNQLIGQILQLPSSCNVNYEDKCKPVLNIQHRCNQNQRSNVSVNTLRFHPSPGMGILYGTNRGHVQHCHIEPDHQLQEKRGSKHSTNTKV